MGGSIALILMIRYEISADFQHSLHLTWLDLCVTVLHLTALHSQIKSSLSGPFLSNFYSEQYTWVSSVWELFSLSQLLLYGILWDFILTLWLCFRKNIEWWSAVIRVQNRWKRICCCHGHKGKKVLLLQWNFSFGTPLLKGHLHSWDAKFGLEKCSRNLCICYLCWSDTSVQGKETLFLGPKTWP